MNRIFLFLISVVVACAIQAQTFDLKGEFRFRPEFRQGYKQLPDSNSESAYFVAQRNRLGLHYLSDSYEVQLTLQETRVWGDQLFKSDKSTIGVLESWVSIKLCDSLQLKTGRQKLIYGNQRLFSENNWSRTGQVHDAAVLQWKSGINTIDFGVAFNQTTENIFGTDYINSVSTIKDNYKTMSFVRISKSIANLNVAAMGVADGFQALNSQTLYVRATEGTEIKYKTKKINFFASGYYQNGHTSIGTEISAWYFNAEIGYNTDKYSILFGNEIMSGDNVKSASATYNQFIPLYCSNHAFNGSMDYFSNMQKSTMGTGLIDNYLKLSYKVHKIWKLQFDYHYFATQQTTLAGGTSIDPFLAHEADLSLKFNFSNNFNLTTGYSVLLGSNTLELLTGRPESNPAHWVFLMLEFKPVFFVHHFSK
ncbi:MAG: hypothetical protein CVU11_12105 [Bacteroidetes bacterium HGW-Bacteroidetes-6]|jgi:hypothetical protein|nr:MAG: hypothetical protein CVU11_12105 [Bacteroidetes bacterium HGW-Bacteroidetes-6]